MKTLGSPNRNEALAVDARQELDLKIGVAFTRFQTRYFQGKYGNLDASVVSYGPCQTPTLNFTVARHLEIVRHTPEPFWTLEVEGRPPKLGRNLPLIWERGRVFDADVGEMFRRMVSEAKQAKVEDVSTKEEKRVRPGGLNTVEMLKAASAGMGMGAHHTMQLAERLYIQGYISYPRTESTGYPAGFDLKGTLKIQRKHPVWGEFVGELLDGGMQRPRGGKDEGDHPPITPMEAVTESRIGGGDAWRLYDFIARHFIASLSPDCVYEKTSASVSVGGEKFSVAGQTVIDHGWTTVMPHRAIEENPLPEMSKGESIPIANVELHQGKTSPPPYLSEAELIGLMEKHGIGTDASIPTHINNIETRNYVKLQSGRRVVPTDLGVTLVQGYHAIDPELALPTIRSHVEKQLNLIAEGKANHGAVVAHTLRQFTEKFKNFVEKIERMDSLFDASFNPTASSGKPFSKCGQCLRYLKLINTRPQRLYCPTQEEVIDLPQGGAVKLYNNRCCSLCGYELLLYTQGDRTYPLCPYCFANPPFQGGPRPKGLVSGCPHPRIHPVVAALAVCPCPECESGFGATLMLEPTGGPKWKLVCTRCTLVVRLPETTHKAGVTRDVCGECGARCLAVDFHKDKTPLAGGKTKHVACISCDDLLNGQIEVAYGKSSGGGRGGRGRGRGRGGRGGRGGRKPMNEHDQKMSFRDF